MSLLPQDKQLPNPAFPSSSASPPMTKTIKEKRQLAAEESDDDLFRVPDMEANLLDQNDEKEKNNSQGRIGKDTSSKNEGSTSSPGGATVIPPKKKRGRNPVDKEYRRIKRLLRNRVSAQQARERKKVYVSDLEWRAKELQDHNFQLEESISTLVNENSMLRKILMNTRPKLDECVETKA